MHYRDTTRAVSRQDLARRRSETDPDRVLVLPDGTPLRLADVRPTAADFRAVRRMFGGDDPGRPVPPRRPRCRARRARPRARRRRRGAGRGGGGDGDGPPPSFDPVGPSHPGSEGSPDAA